MQNEQATSTVIVNGEQAKQELTALEQKSRSLKEQLIAANKAGDGKAYEKLSKQLKNTQKEMKQLQKESFDVKKVLDNLSGSSLRELESAQKRLNSQLRSGEIKRNSREWKENVEAQKAVKAEIKAINAEMQVSQNRFGRFADGFNKYFGAITAGIAALAGLTISLKKFVDLRNQLEDSKANLQALTGLNKDDIEWLSKEATKLSIDMNASGVRIRQSALEIVDAYTLVGSAKPELLENKEALKQVTEQTLILATASKMDLKDAVNGITMAMNQYTASADQASRYTNVLAAGSKYGAANVESQTSAILKAGVAAAQADIPIENLVGTIQTLAEKGIKDEIAGTGLKKFFLILQTGADDTNPKIVGLDQALDNLAKKQLSAAHIKKMFGEEGYNVAAVLLNETERVKYFTQAVTDTSVALEQASINSNTMAAKLAQAKNKLNEAGMEFVSTLNPAILKATNFSTKFLKILVKLPGWFQENKGLLLTLTVALGAYTIALTYNTIAQKANEGATKLLNSAAVKFFKTLLTNPYVAIGVAIAGVTTLIYNLITAKTHAEKSFKSYNQTLDAERIAANQLFSALNNTNIGTSERNNLIKKVNEKYQEYLPNLLTEKSTLDDINIAQNNIISGLREKIALQTRDQAISKIIEENVEDQVGYLDSLRKRISKQTGDETANIIIEEIRKIYEQNSNDLGLAYQKAKDLLIKQKIKTWGGKTAGNNFFDVGSVAVDLSSFNNSMLKMNNGISGVENKFRGLISLTKSNDEEQSLNEPKKGDKKYIDGELFEWSGSTWKKIIPPNDPDESDPYTKAEKQLEKNAKQRILVLQEMFRQMQISEELYHDLSQAQDLLFLEEKLKLQQKFKKDTIDTELSISDAKMKIDQSDKNRAEAHQKALEAFKKLPSIEITEDESIIDITKYSLATRLAIIESFHQKGLLSESEYLNQLANLYKGNQDEINKYLTDKSLKHNQSQYETGIIGRKQYLENVKQITKAYWEETFADESELANKILDIANVASSFISTLAEAETLAVENKYAKQLQAAKKAGEDTTALEEQIEEEKKQVKKKYADIDFGINVAKIIAETALAFMEAAPNIPLQILTAGAGLAQLALANQQRQAVKNLWTGGFTDPGNKYEPRGIVHAGEFVANQDSVKNRTLRRLFNLVDYAQKTNTVPLIDNELIARTIQDRGFASGGFTSPIKQTEIHNINLDPLVGLLSENKTLISMLIFILRNGIKAHVNISGNGGLKEANDLYDELINNAKR